MRTSLSLRTRILCVFSAMAFIVFSGGICTLWYTFQIDSTLDTIVEKDIVLYKIAQDMEVGLANQKGFLTYYLVDGDTKWLNSLGQYRQLFIQHLERALSLDLDRKQRETLVDIAEKYKKYAQAKDFAIENYKQNVAQGNISRLHEKQRDAFFSLLERCKYFSQNQWEVIEKTKTENRLRSSRLRTIAYAAIFFFISLCTIFLFILYNQVLVPIRGLAIETGSTPQESSRDEVASLRHSLKGMMRDFDETHDELARSRKHLLQAERMAMVGELAAGVAHTIRNPFTSIKMRMFSLTRSLDFTEMQQEDLQVISDEIGRIDRIVQNFLEFARPPKLKLQQCCLADLINSVKILLEYRLREHDAELLYQPQPELDWVNIDSDRIKEALVNLITNSCEAMEGGGTISISEAREKDTVMGEIAVIRVSDTGPGIPEAIRHKIMAPFFTTKEDGSGLGLSIVERIVKEHRGKFEISTTHDQHIEFIIKLPVKGDL